MVNSKTQLAGVILWAGDSNDQLAYIPGRSF